MRRPSIFAALTKPPLLTGNKVKLRPKRLEDAANDYSWRHDAELCRLDAAPPILCSFEEFLENHLEDLNRLNRSYRFAIETLEGRHIGNCSYFNLDEAKKEAEMGIMIGDQAYWNCGYGADTIITSLCYFFSQTNIKRVHLKTLMWNIRAQKCFQKCGFIPCGQMIHGDYTFMIMETHCPSEIQRK
ncbi:MAG: GNAT family N-acetyltransferase [Dehalococcoidia bacterium]|nr:GNAT family N-acetyltransferase [Dehalococcoidia bacterium]